jgi:hypothetical protein
LEPVSHAVENALPGFLDTLEDVRRIETSGRPVIEYDSAVDDHGADVVGACAVDEL